ncbi:MAG TPA: tetratricopeptide repeat protein [Pyrinomonadaceae bacterium]|nr:tetratricopeptide repeat protein [Pyrinomonadaceae bacterium]
MLRNKFLLQILTINILILCAGGFASAQKSVADKNALAKFEKSIEQGIYAAIERDLLTYAIANPNDAKGFELLGTLRFAQNRLSEAKSLYQKALSLDSYLVSAKINLALINFQTGNAGQSVFDLDEIADKDVPNDALRLKLAQAFALVGNCKKALSNAEKLGIKIKNGDALPLRAGCYLESGEKQKVNLLIPSAKKLSKQNPTIATRFAEVLSRAAMYKESADVLRSVVLAAPQNADALILLAKSEIYTKDLANAKIHLNRASKIKPQSPDLLSAQALLESEQGNAAQSLSLLEKSLAANPESTTVLSQFIITAMRANQAGKAFKAAEKLLEIKPDEPDFLYLHGASALQSNNLKTAENSLNRFVEFRPQDSLGCLALGLTYAAQPDKLEDARRQFNHCVETNPNNFEAKYQLGLSYKTQGETAKAIEYLEETMKLSPDYAPALRDLGAVYLQSGAESKARVVLEKSVAINPNDADTHFQLSRLYNLLGEISLAKKHLETFQKLKNPNKNGM